VTAARQWLKVDATRIFLAGYGSGGTMALRLAFNQPNFFAGVFSIAGAFPRDLRPLASLNEARRLKVLLASRRDSPQYSQADVCADLRLFHTAGVSVWLRQYPCGDELTSNMLADMDRWIMEQIVAPQPVMQDQPSNGR